MEKTDPTEKAAAENIKCSLQNDKLEKIEELIREVCAAYAQAKHFTERGYLLANLSQAIRGLIHSEWIRCDEMLPNTDREVLAYTPERQFFLAFFNKSWRYSDHSVQGEVLHVIAWRELPEAF